MSSMPIRMPIAFRRVSTQKSPSAKSMALRTTKCCEREPAHQPLTSLRDTTTAPISAASSTSDAISNGST